MSQSSDVLIISWVKHHGRSSGLAEALGGEALYFWMNGNPLRRYMRQFAQTWHALRSRPRDVTLIVMLPPIPALFAVLAASRKTNRRIWVDLHTGVFEDPRWAWAFSITMRTIKKTCDGAIVTNQSLATRAKAAGAKDVVVLDDILSSAIPVDGVPGPNAPIVFPVTYANDEPILEILDAARLVPDIEFILTGNAPREIRTLAPGNVRFTGYIPNSGYEELLSSACAVGALTNRPFTMQRAGYEALERAIPLITSPTIDLQNYFGTTAVYTDAQNSAASISNAAREAASRHREHKSRMRILRDEKLAQQAIRLESFVEQMGAGSRD
jgi:hypothetical protein